MLEKLLDCLNISVRAVISQYKHNTSEIYVKCTWIKAIRRQQQAYIAMFWCKFTTNF